MSRPSMINSTIGEYRLTDLLGAGGMGEVYRGVHSKIGRVVAVKVLSQTSHKPEFVERFLNEACIQASLQHPNIATLYDFLEFNNQPCIIMEYVEGQTLTDRIKASGSLSPSESFRILLAVTEAINYIHSQGIVHRDIKSNNIKITSSGQVKLLDFGIAKSGSSPSLTRTGGFIGTLQYLSPEQFIGGLADARSDIWALGVLLYEMVTGYLPFNADTIGSLYEKVSAALYTPPSTLSPYVPQAVDSVVSRCLKKNPAERYQSAWDLHQNIKRLLEETNRVPLPPPPATVRPPLSAPTFGHDYKPAQAERSRPAAKTSQGKARWPIYSAAAVIVSLMVIGGIYFFTTGETNPAPTTNRPPQQTTVKSNSSPAQSKRITIEMMDGRADVFRNGQMIGTTPYQIEASPGDQIDVVLKRDGFVDKPVHLSVTDNRKVYTFTMERKQ